MPRLRSADAEHLPCVASSDNLTAFTPQFIVVMRLCGARVPALSIETERKSEQVILQVWRWTQQKGWFQEGPSLLGHKDWVRDVAWAPNLGLPMNTIASACQDGKVFIWSEESPGVWEPTVLPDFQVSAQQMQVCQIL